MIARLQRFYGGPPMAWLEMPLGVLLAYIANIPRLRAEAALQSVSETMIGTGSMEKRHAERALQDWQRDAEGQRDASRFPQMTEEQRREHYAATGIFQVEVVDG